MMTICDKTDSASYIYLIWVPKDRRDFFLQLPEEAREENAKDVEYAKAAILQQPAHPSQDGRLGHPSGAQETSGPSWKTFSPSVVNNSVRPGALI